MKIRAIVFISCLLIGSLNSCDKDTLEIPSTLEKIETTKYFDSEIFAESDSNIYGEWKLFDISGGFSGSGGDLNFEYLVVKAYGIYGFIRNDSLLEFGKIAPALQDANDVRLKVELEKDVHSDSFFSDREKYVEFSGNDTLNLYSPCCDRYNYHFKRVK